MEIEIGFCCHEQKVSEEIEALDEKKRIEAEELAIPEEAEDEIFGEEDYPCGMGTNAVAIRQTSQDLPKRKRENNGLLKQEASIDVISLLFVSPEQKKGWLTEYPNGIPWYEDKTRKLRVDKDALFDLRTFPTYQRMMDSLINKMDMKNNDDVQILPD